MYEDGTRKVKYRCDILNGEIKIGELQITQPSISFDSAAEVCSSFTCLVRQNNIIDWYKHRLRPVLIDDGIEKFLGTYIPQYDGGQTDGSETLKNIEAYDLSILAKNDCIIERLGLKAGTLYLSAIENILISCGITKLIADPSDAILQSDRDDWDIGTSKISIINQLLSEMSFNNLFIDNNGYARLTRYENPSINNINFTYKSGQASIIEEGTTLESNIYEIPNVWIATVSNPDLNQVFTASFTNDNPLSKTSTVYRGYRKVDSLKFDNIASQQDLQNAVSKAAFQAMQGEETLSFNTALEAGHGYLDTVALEIPEYNGILSEQSWSMDLDSTKMAHKAKKVVNF